MCLWSQHLCFSSLNLSPHHHSLIFMLSSTKKQTANPFSHYNRDLWTAGNRLAVGVTNTLTVSQPRPTPVWPTDQKNIALQWCSMTVMTLENLELYWGCHSLTLPSVLFSSSHALKRTSDVSTWRVNKHASIHFSHRICWMFNFSMWPAINLTGAEKGGKSISPAFHLFMTLSSFSWEWEIHKSP